MSRRKEASSGPGFSGAAFRPGRVRTLVFDCPDWAVVAAGVSLEHPAAVFVANRAVVTSPAARTEGVVVGMRRREAQARCPELAVLEPDPARDARAFEPVVAALDALCPRIERTAPGRGAFPTRGPSRYFGGDEALAVRVRRLAGAQLPEGSGAVVRVGVADGPFAAALAAGAEVMVPEGASAAFLAPFSLEVLGHPDLVDVLRRLGLRTLGDLAALGHAEVMGRFGALGAALHRLASGFDPHQPLTRPPPPELTVEAELDPPAERVEAAAFVARSLAGELQARLAVRGEACARVLVVVETEHGERMERLWRMDGAGTGLVLSAGAMADRVRWQLDGWLHSADRPTSGINLLRLVPDEVVAATGRQLGFWGGAAGADERVLRALARLEGLLGPDAVMVPEWRGGRDEQLALLPAGAVDLAENRSAQVQPRAQQGWAADGPPPWPGRLPLPAPARVLPEPVVVKVLDVHGMPVLVDGRGAISTAPALLVSDRTTPLEVTAWAGPWPIDERWWETGARRRRARCQVVTADGVARLVTCEGGAWRVEAVYD